MLRQRILTALVLAPLAIAIILFMPTGIVALVIGSLCLIAAWEWTRLAGLVSRSLRAGIVALSAGIMLLLWLARDQPLLWTIIGAGIAWWLLSLAWLRNFSYAAAPTRENTLLKLLAGAFAILPAWLALVQIHASPGHGHAWTLFVFLLIWAADIGAYFAGRRFGTIKLAPNISPNKTRAGVWGALAAGGSVALVGGVLFGLRDVALVALVALAAFSVLASIVGDLIESLLKRQANVKDSGTLFPGHGGLLDRIDSLLAAIPVFAVGKMLIDLALHP